MKWLFALSGSSLTFALADVICDVCISEHSDEKPAAASQEQKKNKATDGSRDGADAESSDDSGIEMAQLERPGTPNGVTKLEKRNGGGARYHRADLRDPDESAGDDMSETEDKRMSGEQDAAIAGLVTILVVVATVCTQLMTGYTNPNNVVTGSGSSFIFQTLSESLHWGPFTHVEFWLAVSGGFLAFLHYLLLLKAFEGAPSTVLLPLVQMASVWVLLASSITAWMRQQRWITPVHFVAYAFMFVGGLVPACDGQLGQLLDKRFWQQRYVWYAILSEVALGLHDLLLSACSYDGGEGEESWEFFFYSRCSFCVMFVAVFAGITPMRRQFIAMFSGGVSSRYVWLSACSEGLTIVGFYLSSIAFGLFYQPSIVHAAEASMSQLFNLLIACILVKVFGIGRASSAEKFGTKLVSFLLVATGLFLCTIE